MSVFLVFIIFLAAVGILYEQRRKRISRSNGVVAEPVPVAVPSLAVWTPVGRWAGQLVPGSTGTWGGTNDEHEAKVTAQVLAERPDWLGLGYCPGGDFEFVVDAAGRITGAATIYGVRCDVQGMPVIALDGCEIEFTVLAHMVRLKFEGNIVSGLLWEGHDELKRANIVGGRL